MTFAMEALSRNDKLFHSALKILENTTAVLPKVACNDSQALKTGVNGHNEDFDVLKQSFQNFLELKPAIPQNISDMQHLPFVNTNAYRVFTACTKVLRNFV